MNKIYEGLHYVLYSHIAICDTEDNTSYPFFEPNSIEDIIFCSKGVTVTTINDTEIKVVVYQSEKKIENSNYLSGQIEVGKEGLTVGNETTGHTAVIPCPPGKLEVFVCADFTTEDSMTVTFILFNREKKQ